MKTLERSRYDMLTRSSHFGAAHRHLFPEHSTAHALFSTIATEVAAIEALAVTEQVVSQSARATRKADSRKQLLDGLVRAVNTAWVLSRTVPTLAADTELPASMGDRQLLTIARAFVAAARPHAEQFAAHGIAIDSFGVLIEAFETALNERNTRRDELSQTRGRLEESMTRALQAVETLDVVVGNTLANNPVALAAWKRERRLARIRRPRAGAAGKRGAPGADATAETSPVAPDEKAA